MKKIIIIMVLIMTINNVVSKMFDTKPTLTYEWDTKKVSILHYGEVVDEYFIEDVSIYSDRVIFNYKDNDGYTTYDCYYYNNWNVEFR